MLTPELEQYYQERFNLCASLGWRHLLEDLQRMKASINTLEGIENLQELGKRQGMLELITWMEQLGAIAEHAYGKLKEDTEQEGQSETAVVVH